MTLAVLQKQAPIKINEARLILIHSRRRLMGEASERDDYDCPWPMTNGTALCSQAGRFLSVGIKTLSGYHRGHQRHHHCHLLFVACSSCCTWCWLYVKWAKLHSNQGHYGISEMFSNNSAHCHFCNNRQLVISLIALQTKYYYSCQSWNTLLLLFFNICPSDLFFTAQQFDTEKSIVIKNEMLVYPVARQW